MSAKPADLARLDQWLRDYDYAALADATEQLGEAVRHFQDCDGICHSMECDKPETGKPCRKRCADRCVECKQYAEGWQGTWTGQRAVSQLLEEVEARQVTLFELAS